MRAIALLFTLALGCTSSGDAPRTAGSGESGGSGGDTASIDDAATPTDDADAQDDGRATPTESGSPSVTTDGPAYHPSCDLEVCTVGEKCVTMTAGSRCMHACAGQLTCAAGKSCYCTRQGGAFCVPD
jgi:hypothetical protein